MKELKLEKLLKSFDRNREKNQRMGTKRSLPQSVKNDPSGHRSDCDMIVEIDSGFTPNSNKLTSVDAPIVIQAITAILDGEGLESGEGPSWSPVVEVALRKKSVRTKRAPTCYRDIILFLVAY